MRPTGIRVINVFPGPIDDEWNQNLPPPKVDAAALASAIVKALKEGIEDVYPATSRRSGSSAGARIRRCSSASWRPADSGRCARKPPFRF
jgi:hypothetical protein